MSRGPQLLAIIIGLLLPSFASGQDKFFDSNGVRIRYVEAGTGDVVMLLHGQGSSADGNEWGLSGIFKELARTHRVIAVDMRGHGKSDKPHDPKLYGREMAMDVIRLQDHLNVRKAHIAGYSLGAIVVSHLLGQHSDRFATAIVAGAAAPVSYTPETLELDDVEATERERDGISRTMLQRLAPAGSRPLSEEEFKKRSAAALADPAQDRFAVAAMIRARRQLTLDPNVVRRVTAPVLGIVGGADPVGRRLLEAFVKIRPATKLVVIEGATHSVQIGSSNAAAYNHPQFLASIQEFLSSHRN